MSNYQCTLVGLFLLLYVFGEAFKDYVIFYLCFMFELFWRSCGVFSSSLIGFLYLEPFCICVGLFTLLSVVVTAKSWCIF